MTLLEARKGSRVRILEIPDDRARAQCIRFGIGEGTVVDWAEPLRAGPVLVRQANQEICLGRRLASCILIEHAEPVDSVTDPVRGAGRVVGGAEGVRGPQA